MWVGVDPPEFDGTGDPRGHHDQVVAEVEVGHPSITAATRVGRSGWPERACPGRPSSSPPTGPTTISTGGPPDRRGP